MRGHAHGWVSWGEMKIHEIHEMSGPAHIGELALRGADTHSSRSICSPRDVELLMCWWSTEKRNENTHHKTHKQTQAHRTHKHTHRRYCNEAVPPWAMEKSSMPRDEHHSTKC